MQTCKCERCENYKPDLRESGFWTFWFPIAAAVISIHVAFIQSFNFVLMFGLNPKHTFIYAAGASALFWVLSAFTEKGLSVTFNKAAALTACVAVVPALVSIYLHP